MAEDNGKTNRITDRQVARALLEDAVDRALKEPAPPDLRDQIHEIFEWAVKGIRLVTLDLVESGLVTPLVSSVALPEAASSGATAGLDRSSAAGALRVSWDVLATGEGLASEPRIRATVTLETPKDEESPVTWQFLDRGEDEGGRVVASGDVDMRWRAEQGGRFGWWEGCVTIPLPLDRRRPVLEVRAHPAVRKHEGRP